MALPSPDFLVGGPGRLELASRHLMCFLRKIAKERIGNEACQAWKIGLQRMPDRDRLRQWDSVATIWDTRCRWESITYFNRLTYTLLRTAGPGRRSDDFGGAIPHGVARSCSSLAPTFAILKSSGRSGRPTCFVAYGSRGCVSVGMGDGKRAGRSPARSRSRACGRRRCGDRAKICGQYAAGCSEVEHDLRNRGYARSVGVSTHDRKLAATISADPRLDVLMLRYNVAHRGAEDDVFPHLKSSRPGIVVFNVAHDGVKRIISRGWVARRRES